MLEKTFFGLKTVKEGPNRIGRIWNLNQSLLFILICCSIFCFLPNLSMASSSSYTAAVIWMHGLGDSGEGWSYLRRVYSEMNWIRWVFPTAPVQPVTCNGGYESTSWFDIDRIPVTESETDNPRGLEDSIALVHEHVAKLVEEGIPTERIIIGGFSQGAVLSLQAGLSSQGKLAGIVAFSGWLVRKDQLDSLISDANKETPILICHGNQDQVVKFTLSQIASHMLQEKGFSVTFNDYPMQHSSCNEELQHLKEYILDVVPAA